MILLLVRGGFILISLFQFYRQARVRALKAVYPDYVDEVDEELGGRFSYPRPISEPPSPSHSRKLH